MTDYAEARAVMVETQVRTADVTNLAIQAAMREVPRERFVPAAKRGIAYMDGCIEIARGRYLLDPRTFSRMLQLADIQAADRVLDVACATGYSTAVISRLCRSVIGLEQDADLVRIAIETLATSHAGAEIAQGPLPGGLPQRAPFDAIFINGGIATEPKNLLSQLADGGRLVCAFRVGAAGYGRIYVKHDGAIGSRDVFDTFPPMLPGFKEQTAFAF
ncbi:MAG: protein-L-isoaspartate O-methyltransferase family protein [Alphaproteobacteria bacterium]